MTYAEKLKHPKWQKRRLEILERDGFECYHCGDKEKTLHVHHAWYEARKDPWDYPDEALSALCEDCHQRAEKKRLELLRLVAAHGCIADIAIGLARAFDDEINGSKSNLRDLDSFETILGYLLGERFNEAYHQVYPRLNAERAANLL